MATRSQNEKEFGNWDALPDGGRRYWFDRKGGAWGFQRMIKIVDADENTLFVIQEIYNDDGELYERHQKYPVDTGHELLKRRELDEEGDEG
jgi:hypothetical protein